jgi:hypothetical protein
VLLKGLAPLTLVIAIAGPASADVKSVASNGFEVASAATIAAPPDRVYAALGEVGRWWSPSHTFSRDAANLSIELRAGGCFCEKLRMAVRFSTSPSFMALPLPWTMWLVATSAVGSSNGRLGSAEFSTNSSKTSKVTSKANLYRDDKAGSNQGNL